MNAKNNIHTIEPDILESIGQVIVAYYNQISPFNPTDLEYDLWISSLREPMKSECKKNGLKKCTDHLNFVRFVLELRDFGMDDYMKKHLSKRQYNYWKYDDV